MVYNMTNFTSANNIYEMYEAVNQLTDYWLSVLVVVSLFLLITILLLRRNLPSESISAASLVCLIVSLFLYTLQMLPVIWVIGFGVILALSAISLYGGK